MSRVCYATLFLVLAATAFGLAAEEPKKELKLSPAEAKILHLTNAERRKKDLSPLKPSTLLFKVARAHSANMAKQGKMAHELDGKDYKKRVLEAGYDYNYVGENIAEERGVTFEELMKAWMDSPHHRDNILNKKFTEIGLGVARGKDGKAYYTQVFGKPFPPELK